MHVEDGSSVVLKCTVSDYLKRPTYIFWYLDDRRLITGQEGITIEDNVSLKSSSSVSASNSWQQHTREDFSSLYSILSVREANRKFSGKYSCVPDNLRPASINVHVILGEFIDQKSMVKVNLRMILLRNKTLMSLDFGK